MLEVYDKMPFHYKFTYKLETSEAEFYFLKGRPDQVMFVGYVSVYNSTQSNFTHLYLLCRARGVVSRCDYHAACNTKFVRKFTADHYLTDGEEMGIAITGADDEDTVEVVVHGLRMKNVEYHKRILG